MRFPYQEANGQMTNGEHSFEIRRTRSDNVPEERWQEFLKSIKGKLADEVQLPEWVKLRAKRAGIRQECSAQSTTDEDAQRQCGYACHVEPFGRSSTKCK